MHAPPPAITAASAAAALQLQASSHLPFHVQNALLCGFDFVMAPLVHPRYRRPAPTALPQGTFQPPFTRSDLLLSSSQWAGQVVGKVSPWIDCDSPSPALARDSVAALQQELAWAAHLSLQAVVLPPPQQPLSGANYARILNQVGAWLWQIGNGPFSCPPRSVAVLRQMHSCWQRLAERLFFRGMTWPALLPLPGPLPQVLGGLTSMALWLRIPASASSSTDSTDPSAAAGGAGSAAPLGERARLAADPWEWWSQLRFLCHHNSRLGVVLELGADLPSTEDLQRWRGEPLKWAGLGGAAGMGWDGHGSWQLQLGELPPVLGWGGQRAGSAAVFVPHCSACRQGLQSRSRPHAAHRCIEPSVHRCTRPFRQPWRRTRRLADLVGLALLGPEPARPHLPHLPPRAVLVPTAIFMTNKRGYPTLSKRHQEFLTDCFRRGVQARAACWADWGSRLGAAWPGWPPGGYAGAHTSLLAAQPGLCHSRRSACAPTSAAPGCAGCAVGQRAPLAARVGACRQRGGSGSRRRGCSRGCAAQPPAPVLGVPVLFVPVGRLWPLHGDGTRGAGGPGS